MCVVYGMSVKQAIFNVVERENVEAQISLKNSELSDLESRYIALKNSIDINVAYAEGFKDSKDTQFITKSTLSVRHMRYE
jgi:hypothetical protein